MRAQAGREWSSTVTLKRWRKAQEEWARCGKESGSDWRGVGPVQKLFGLRWAPCASETDESLWTTEKGTKELEEMLRMILKITKRRFRTGRVKGRKLRERRRGYGTSPRRVCWRTEEIWSGSTLVCMHKNCLAVGGGVMRKGGAKEEEEG